MRPMVSTSPRLARRVALFRTALLAATALGVAGCAVDVEPPAPPGGAADLDAASFIMADGARLPYRTWVPSGAPTAVVLALHGFNDSRDAWVLPGAALAEGGFVVYAYDQRGFGAAPLRGGWAGRDAMVQDAAALAALLRRRHPGIALILMGESMGGAVLMCLATSPLAPAGARYVLLAPAVWGGSQFNPFYRAALWLAATVAPNLTASRPPPGIRIVPTDNMEAWDSLSRNPLSLRSTRFGSMQGLLDLMDSALAAAPALRAPALFLYGGKDMLIPAAATRATWNALPPGQARLAFYPTGYHLLPRDLERATPIGDIIAWIRNPSAPLPSGADLAAEAWRVRPSG